MAYIIYKKLNNTKDEWNIENFLTGGQTFSSYKEGMKNVKKLRQMSSIKYRLVKIK